MRYDSIQSYTTIKEKEGIPISDLQNPLDHIGEIAWRSVKAPPLFLDQETMREHMVR
jgi:hypothetical protein